MNGNQLLVSVISLVYNSGRNCIRAYESLLRQTYTNYEHIIIDDGSTDDSVAVIKDWIKQNKHACRFEAHKKNQGICKSLNHALSLAKGRYWCPLCDDLWMPDRLEYMVNLTGHYNSQNIGMYCGPAEVVDPALNHLCLWESDKVLAEHGCPNEQVKTLFPPDEKKILLSGGDVYNYLFYTNLFHPVSSMYDMQATREVGCFDESLPFEDWDFAFRMVQHHDVLYTRVITTQYVRHPGSFMMKRRESLLNGKIRLLEMHYPSNPKFDEVRINTYLQTLEGLRDHYKNELNFWNYLITSYKLASVSNCRVWWLKQFPIILKRCQSDGRNGG